MSDQDTFGIEYKSSILNSYNPDNTGLVKGDKEGSRGGNVIGHTGSGKAIYMHSNAMQHKYVRAKAEKHQPSAVAWQKMAVKHIKDKHGDFSSEDHKEASAHYHKLARQPQTGRHKDHKRAKAAHLDHMARIHDMASEGHPSLAPHLPQTAAKSATDNPDLVKASHTYDKRVAKPGGGYNYIYAKDAHHHAKKEAHHRDMAKISYHDAPNSLTALEGLPEGTSFKEARSHHDEMSESHRQSKISFAGEHGGKVLGTTRRDGHEMTIEEHGEHPTKEGKTRISARTEIPHVHKTPHIVRYDQKVMVKDSHNTDTGMVTYTEHDPESHLIDTDQRLRDGGFRTSYTQDRRTPGKFEVTGSPILRAGGELPHTINDPHHGELKVLSHNSDSGKTIYSVGGKIPMAKSDFGIKYKTSIAQTYQGENNE